MSTTASSLVPPCAAMHYSARNAGAQHYILCGHRQVLRYCDEASGGFRPVLVLNHRRIHCSMHFTRLHAIQPALDRILAASACDFHRSIFVSGDASVSTVGRGP